MNTKIDKTVNEKIIYKKFNLYSALPSNESYTDEVDKFAAAYTIIVPTNDKHQQPNISAERIINAVNNSIENKNAALKEYLPPLILTSKHDKARYDLTHKYFDVVSMLRPHIVFADYDDETDIITIKPVTRKMGRRIHHILYKMIDKYDYAKSRDIIESFIERFDSLTELERIKISEIITNKIY